VIGFLKTFSFGPSLFHRLQLISPAAIAMPLVATGWAHCWIFTKVLKCSMLI